MLKRINFISIDFWYFQLFYKLKSHFQARAITLLSHWPSVYGQSSNEYVNAATLPDLVRTDLDCLRSSRLASHNDYAMGPILERHFSVLATICHDHCLGVVRTYNSVKLEYNLAKKKTLELKLNCLHQEVLAQTYTHQVLFLHM